MTAKLTERAMKTQLIIAGGIVAAIIVIGIASQSAFAIKVSKSFQQGYDAGFAAGKKDRLNGNEFDNKPPKDRSYAYDEGYRRGYEDGWSSVHHFDSNSVAASSSSAVAGDGGHKHKDSAAASSSSSAADDASAASSSAAAAGGGSATASSSSSASS